MFSFTALYIADITASCGCHRCAASVPAPARSSTASGMVTRESCGLATCACMALQVFFYKRAQIFTGDVWGAFQGQGLGAFDDIAKLTMFADYRVPVVLKHMGILRYSDVLQAKVDAQEVLPAGAWRAEQQRRALPRTGQGRTGQGRAHLGC